MLTGGRFNVPQPALIQEGSDVKRQDHMEDECAPALRTNPAYLSRRGGSPASRRHVRGRPDNFIVSAPCTAWP